MPSIITLTTDFGLTDGYVAAMKGVVLSLNPTAVLVDVTHLVPAQDILHGAYVLSTVHDHFPEGTVHRAVVDPGVSTPCRAIAVTWRDRYYVGPDNGLLSLAVPLDDGHPPEDWIAVELTNRDFHMLHASATFHGRDIFAPAAAHLSLGGSLANLGPTIDSLESLGIKPAWLTKDGAVSGAVVHVDAYGNLITNIPREMAPAGSLEVLLGTVVMSMAKTYDAAEGLMALWGSEDTLEIAVRDGSATESLGLGRGERVTLSPIRHA
jgi:hypothetical protein